jgi:hypothetical protein
MLCAHTLEVSLATKKEMKMDNSESIRFPMLEAILAIRGLQLQPLYTNRDVAKIFKVCVRAIQNWIAAGKLIPRDLPGRWKFFSQDLEDFLVSSRKGQQ